MLDVRELVAAAKLWLDSSARIGLLPIQARHAFPARNFEKKKPAQVILAGFFSSAIIRR